MVSNTGNRNSQVLVKDAEELEGILASSGPDKKIPVDLVATGRCDPSSTSLHPDGASLVTVL